MNMEGYFDRIKYAIDNMSDEEFDLLLLDSGIEDCPYEELRLDEELVYGKLRNNMYYVNSINDNANYLNITEERCSVKMEGEFYKNSSKFTYNSLAEYSFYDCNIEKVA